MSATITAMADDANSSVLPALDKDDDGLLKELLDILRARVSGDPYSQDGKFAEDLSPLPPGLRAMAAPRTP